MCVCVCQSEALSCSQSDSLPTQLLHVGVERDARDGVSVALEVTLERRILLQKEGWGILINTHQQLEVGAFPCLEN